MKQPFTSLRSVCTHKESGCARCIDRQSPLDMRVLQNSENASNIENQGYRICEPSLKDLDRDLTNGCHTMDRNTDSRMIVRRGLKIQRSSSASPN